MDRFLNPLGFITCIHLVKSPKKVFGKGKKTLEGDRVNNIQGD